MIKEVNIISFDVPYPANYGGVIDVYYKIKALYKAGIKVHLHCFEYGRKKADELLRYCETTTYYHRNISSKLLFNQLPYIVISRQNNELVKNLNKNEFPIICEGLHTTHIFEDDNWIGRNIIVRTHNIEHEYYKQLANVERNIFKKYYFLNESNKLFDYENKLKNANGLACISESDKSYFQKYHSNTRLINAFHGNEFVTSKVGKGNYILYHGNLSVAENHETAIYILEKLANHIDMKIVIAGAKPRSELKEKSKGIKNIELISNPNNEKMKELLENAHVHFLITKQSTGVKLKLLNSLHQGRHCVVNQEMITNSKLDEVCHIIDSSNIESVVNLLNDLRNKEFTSDDKSIRSLFLEPFNDDVSVIELVKMINEY